MVWTDELLCQVAVLFLQILFVVWDRLNFLYRSVLMKVVLQYFQVVFFCYLMFMSWPKVGAAGQGSDKFRLADDDAN